MNIIEQIKEKYGLDSYFTDNCYNEVTYEKAVHLEIYTFEPHYITMSFKLPKNLTLEWVSKKIETKLNQKSNYKRLFDGLNLAGFYNTTYGVGVFMPSWNENRIKELEQRLNDLNIEYKTQYSDAHWVFRFVFSKSEKNINKINSLLN